MFWRTRQLDDELLLLLLLLLLLMVIVTNILAGHITSFSKLVPLLLHGETTAIRGGKRHFNKDLAKKFNNTKRQCAKCQISNS